LPLSPRLLSGKVKKYEKFMGVAKAIQLVALSNLKILKKKITSRFLSLIIANLLFIEIWNFIKSVFSDINDLMPNIKVVILISDKSCCGVINNQLLKAFEEQTIEWNEWHLKYQLFIIGNKGSHRLSKKYRELIVGSLKKIEKEIISFCITNTLSYKLGTTSFFDRMIIFFNRYFDTFDHRVSYYDYLNYSHFLFTCIYLIIDEKSVLYNFYDAKDKWWDLEILPYFYYYWLNILYLDSFEETEYCELGARAQTMEIAVKNTKDVINSLRLRYNKARQSNITNEIIEILNASDNIV
jgi:ATP synthase F1 gamma subunit